MITEFYKDREIFVTGGSGVVGKAAIEKLLRSCNVKRIYVLIRQKKGVSPKERLEEIKNTAMFNVLKERKPSELNKLVAIPGNTGLDGLGISTKDREKIKNVSIFIHSAASTRFLDPLKSVIRMNVKSTLEALTIAETLKDLKLFLHVSTYFSNPHIDYIEDKIYRPLFDWRIALKLLEDNRVDPFLDAIMPKIIQGFPNTYIFTKHLAEQLVNDYRHKIPVAIFRPSIVLVALNEPEVGFTETQTGIMGLMALWGTGLLQAIHIKDRNFRLDMTPLDVGTKCMLIFAMLKAQLSRERFIEATPVGKFSSTAITPISLTDFCNRITKSTFKYPLQKSFWIPNVTVTSCLFLQKLIFIFQQILPAIILDLLLRLFGKEPFMMKVQRKFYISMEAFSFFMEKQFGNDGITDFDEMLRLGEGNEFDLSSDVRYMQSHVTILDGCEKVIYGTRKFLLNEPDSTIDRCKKILKAKGIAYNILRGYLAYLIFRALVRILMEYFNI